MKYDANLTLREARDLYLQKNGFDYEFKRWVRIRTPFFNFYIPNTHARHEAVRIHDLHHVLTEYDTDIPGEAEIGAWEVASGIPGRYAYGILLDGMGALFGLLHSPRRVIRAFISGLRCRNLYFRNVGDKGSLYEALLNEKVGTVRARVMKNCAKPNSAEN